jgi:hypothetical protein
MTVNWNPGPTTALIVQGARQAVANATEGVLGEGNRLIASPPKSGRVYKRRGIEHQASAPGESPATDTGALIQSGQALYPDSGDPMVITGIANWSTDYALALETGTETMEARPYARPALDQVAPSLPAGIAAAIKASLR